MKNWLQNKGVLHHAEYDPDFDMTYSEGIVWFLLYAAVIGVAVYAVITRWTQ